MEDVEVGDDIIGIYFVYPNVRERKYKDLLPNEPIGIMDCSEHAHATKLHIHQYDTFENVPQMKKILCFDNDLRKKYTTRGLFEDVRIVLLYLPSVCLSRIHTVALTRDTTLFLRRLFVKLLGGYNTIYFMNWRGIRTASHRVRLPDADDKDPWGASNEVTFICKLGRNDDLTLVRGRFSNNALHSFASHSFVL